MSGFIQVTTTVDSEEKAVEIAKRLLEQHLAACVQVAGPITSRYWWQGVQETAMEWTCTAKTRKDLFPVVEDAVRAIHPYEVPEITAVEIGAGNDAYLDWITAETTPPEQAGE